MKDLLKFVLTCVLLWLATRGVDFSSSIALMQTVPLWTLGIIVAALFAQLMITSARFVVVLRLFDITYGFWESVRCNLIGSFFTQTFLSFLGGDMARVWLLTRLNAPLRVATGAVLLDRIWGLIVNILLALSGIIPLLQATDDLALRWGLMILTACGFSILVMFFLLGIFRDGIQNIAPFSQWRSMRHITELIIDLARLSHRAITSGRESAVIFLMSLVMHLITVAIVQILLIALGVNVGFIDCSIVVPTIILITMIPISIGGWGVRENAMVIGFGLFSIPGDKALAASILIGLLSLLYGLAGGVVWLADARGKKT